MSLDKLVDSTQLDSDLTSVANAIRAKSGGSAQLAFPAGFVSEIGNIPSGGGGSTVVASGTFIGNDNSVSGYVGRQFISVGKKMPQTDFYLRLNAKNGEEFPYDTNYKIVVGFVTVFSKDGFYDLSTNGQKDITKSSYAVDINNSGAVSSIQPGAYIGWMETIRNGGVGNTSAPNYANIERSDDGFTVLFGMSNAIYRFPPIEYEWEIVYFGSNPSTDIVEIP